MINTQIYCTSNKKETRQVGSKIAKSLVFGDVVYLYGNLGVGKTLLSKGIIDQITHTDNIIKSPTFNIVNTYFGGKICHLDLYRLLDSKELEYLDLQQYFAPNILTLVEWPEIGKDFLPEATHLIYIEYTKQGRKIRVIYTK